VPEFGDQQPPQRVEHRGERGAADAVVELVGERLRVDVGGIHHRIEPGAPSNPD